MNYTPEQVRFFKQFLMEDSSRLLITRDSVDGVISMAFLRAFTEDRTFIKNRNVPRYGDASGSVTTRIRAGLKTNERILIMSCWLNRETIKLVEDVNRKSLKAGNGYKIIVVGSTPHPEMYNKYTWYICDCETASSSSTIAGLLLEMAHSVPKKKLPHTGYRFSYNPDSEQCINGLCDIANAVALNDSTTIYGILGTEFSILINGVNNTNKAELVELVQNLMLGIVKGQVFADYANMLTMNLNKFGFTLPRNFEEAYFDSLSGCRLVADNMDNVAVKCDFADIASNFDKPLTTYLVVGISGSDCIGPATVWMDRHPSCDILAVWDPMHPRALTLRSREVDIHSAIYKDSTLRSSYGKAKTRVRVSFKPEALVLSGKVLNNDCGFTGEFIGQD